MESAIDSLCEVCNKEYKKLESSPKCLTCSHIFCSYCIANLTATTVKCPNCFATISILTAENIDIINHSLQRLSSDKPVTVDTANPGSLSSSPREEKTYPNKQEISLLGTDSDPSSIYSKNVSTEFDTSESPLDTSQRPPREQEHDLSCEQNCKMEELSKSDADFMSQNFICESPEIGREMHNELLSSIEKVHLNVPITTVEKGSSHCSTSSGSEPLNLLSQECSNTLSERNTEVELDKQRDSCDSETLPSNSKIPARLPFTKENCMEMKENEIQKFTDQIQILHEVIETVDDAILTLQVEKEQQEKENIKLKIMIEAEENKIKSSRLKIEEAQIKKKLVLEITDVLKEREEQLSNESTFDSLKETLEASSSLLATADELGTNVEVYYMHFLLSRDVPKPEYLERMIDLGETVSAELLVDGESRWANITLADNKLHIHALVAKSPATNSKILPWKCVKKMVSREKAMTFMDIGDAGSTIGRIYFSMLGNSPRAQQFVVLSSGELKYCYRNTKMKQLGNPEEPAEYISFHGPKTLKGAPIPGVVPGIVQGGIYTRRKTAGLLAGAALSHRQRTLFVIYLEPDLEEYTTGAFGEVMQGLEFLKKVSKHDPVKDISVLDCGLVIPLSNNYEENNQIING